MPVILALREAETGGFLGLAGFQPSRENMTPENLPQKGKGEIIEKT